MAKITPSFGTGSVEEIARSIGELFSGSVLTRVIRDAKLDKYDPGEGNTKWRRIAAAMDAQQRTQGDGRPVLSMILSAMQPDRHFGVQAQAKICREELNVILALSELRVRDDGLIGKAKKAATMDEAMTRAGLLRTHLEQRGAHPEVVRQCRPELLKADYYEAVFEAIKGLGDRMRRMGGIDLDGRNLIQSTMRGKDPAIKINAGATATQRNEQEGTALIAEGLFAAFRNPAAHEPQLTWKMSEQDALDVLGTASLVHRRLDDAK